MGFLYTEKRSEAAMGGGGAEGAHTVKKIIDFPVPSPGGHFPNSPWQVIINLFPPRESLVGDFPAGDGKIDSLFLQCSAPFYVLMSLKKTGVRSARAPTHGENPLVIQGLYYLLINLGPKKSKLSGPTPSNGPRNGFPRIQINTSSRI